MTKNFFACIFKTGGKEIGTKKRSIEIAREILRSYGFSNKTIWEITKNEKMFLKLFRAFHSKSGSKKKHWDISYLIRKIAKPHERKKARKLIDRFLKLNILRRDSGKSVGFSEIGSKISIALAFNQTFAFQENRTSSFEKPRLNMGVQNI